MWLNITKNINNNNNLKVEGILDCWKASTHRTRMRAYCMR
jgi:hypothetical protein